MVSEDSQRTVSQAVWNHIIPRIHPEVKKETYAGRDVIAVRFSGTQQPYLAYNIPRIRVADEDLVMEQPVYEAMLRKRSDVRYSWERQLSKYCISDIDRKIFKDYLERARKAGRIDFIEKDEKSVLTRLDLVDGDSLLNAGAALFVESGINELQMAKFASDRRLTFTDIRRYTGSILSLIELAVRYVIDAMDWRVEFDGHLQRNEIPEIPVDAVREAITNAFAHRSIESGQSVEVAVYRSFIDIYSPGKFPDGLTPEMFITEAISPVRRNPLITRTLYYSKDTESFATGLKRIQDACDDAGCKVEYKATDYGFTVRFHRHCGSGWGTNISDNDAITPLGEPFNKPHEDMIGTRNDDAGTRKDDAGTRKDDVGTHKQAEDSQKQTTLLSQDIYSSQILQMISTNNKISRKEMAAELSISERTVQRLLNSMSSVRFTGRGKNGHWEFVDKK